jgi:hypothetical protein
MSRTIEPGARPAGDFDAVVVGAGFAGLYMLHRLRALGLRARAYEAGGGGTWYWNRYQGARCGVESMDYSYSFSDDLQQEWRWTERYASQPEILKYIEQHADWIADCLAHLRAWSRPHRGHRRSRGRVGGPGQRGGSRLLSAFVMLFVCFEVFCFAMMAVLAQWLLEANLLAALAMLGYLLRKHRVAWRAFLAAP